MKNFKSNTRNTYQIYEITDFDQIHEMMGYGSRIMNQPREKAHNENPSYESRGCCPSNRPELLAPAGSAEALDAAIAGGADAVYFGASAFNARMNAANFDRDAIKRAIEKCRNYGVRSNITFNTLVYEREIPAALDEVGFLYECGANALIVADIGLAREIKKHFPSLELHASTQASIHNTLGAVLMSKLGFSRAVIARELDRDMIKSVCENSPIETEIFIHGALCVSHSGQCLFSSLVGSRSGNRGECAQPCRLPYSGGYPLSLKDNCLAASFKDVLSLGATSLKIEGRMKSPDYVYGVTSIYRHLIDDRRNATQKEIDTLAALFSRSGFTDGYYKRNISPAMNGIRTESDKARTIEGATYDVNDRRRKLFVHAKLIESEKSELTLTLDGTDVCATVYGDVPMKAISAPLTEDAVKKSLSKFGSTDFICGDITLELGHDLMLPVSLLNKLRRDAIKTLEEKLHPYSAPDKRISNTASALDEGETECAPHPHGDITRSASFLFKDAIPDGAKDHFDVIYLPLENFDASVANGVALPPVMFDREVDEVKRMLAKAAADGAKYALVTNLGQITLARSYGFILQGDLRLNAANPLSVVELVGLGLSNVIVSPELSLSRISGMGENTSVTVYGRIPLMLVEKCVIKQLSGCKSCDERRAKLTDRTGECFPVYRTFKHRNTIYNSRVTYMADKKDELRAANVHREHYIFTDESADRVGEIIKAYELGLETDAPFRRIPKK